MTRIPEWLKTDHPREVIEAALGLVVRNRIEAAYARSDLFERLRVLDLPPRPTKRSTSRVSFSGKPSSRLKQSNESNLTI